MDKQVCLNRGEEQDIENGSLWIYDNEIDWCTDTCSDGDVVTVLDSRRRFCAKGFFNSKSKIVVRVLTRDKDEEIDREFFRKRITRAWEYRKSIGLTDACRVVFGDSDGLPGLTVDKFGDYLSFQMVSLGLEGWKPEILEILVELYMKQMNISPENKDLDNRDRFVLSKGHSVESYYAVLAKKGFFPMEEVISTFSQFGSKFIGHPNNKLPGIEMNSGSLGHGLPVCVGMAMAGKMDRKDYRVYVVMGDGELAEGSVWEGAMAASHYCLDNLCAVVDRNRLQISGCTEDVMGPR